MSSKESCDNLEEIFAKCVEIFGVRSDVFEIERIKSSFNYREYMACIEEIKQYMQIKFAVEIIIRDNLGGRVFVRMPKYFKMLLGYFGEEYFYEKSDIQLCLDQGTLNRIPLELFAFIIGHEFAHIKLFSLGITASESTVDLVAMMHGLSDIIVKGKQQFYNIYGRNDAGMSIFCAHEANCLISAYLA